MSYPLMELLRIVTVCSKFRLIAQPLYLVCGCLLLICGCPRFEYKMALPGNDTKAEYRLYYWQIPGRGEYARLMFAETEVSYNDVLRHSTEEEAKKLGYSAVKDHPVFPYIEHGDLVISQSGVISRYLARKLAGGILYPKTEKEQLKAEMLMHSVLDVVQEGCVAWHPISYTADYEDQKEEAQAFIMRWTGTRLVKWMDRFQAHLRRNHDSNGGKLFYIGSDLTYVDLMIFHLIDGVKFSCADVLSGNCYDLLDEFHKSIKSRPRIKAWLECTERHAFCGNSPIM